MNELFENAIVALVAFLIMIFSFSIIILVVMLQASIVGLLVMAITSPIWVSLLIIF